MKFMISVVAATFLIAQVSFADVITCNLKKVVKNSNGTPALTSCKATIDSDDLSGSEGAGSISREKSVGTFKTDCADYPADYDLTTDQVKPFQMWDQGKRSDDDTKSLFDWITAQGYLNNGNLGFNPADAASVEWYAGGEGAILTNLYVAFDKNGKKLGVILLAGMSPFQSFQGCYIQ
jgi:hypothetical protein